jgi:sugar lactone lactonase YvrE
MQIKTDYGWLDKTSTNAPSLNPAIYRFRPSTGMVQVASTALRQPNGTRFSPSGKILYVTDTGAASGSLSVPFDEISYTLDYRGPQTIYVFDVVQYSTKTSSIINQRPIYQAVEWAG